LNSKTGLFSWSTANRACLPAGCLVGLEVGTDMLAALRTGAR
jgi:hypothetical protein